MKSWLMMLSLEIEQGSDEPVKSLCGDDDGEVMPADGRAETSEESRSHENRQ